MMAGISVVNAQENTSDRIATPTQTPTDIQANFNESSLYVEDSHFDHNNKTVTITLDSTDVTTHFVTLRNFVYSYDNEVIKPQAEVYEVNGKTTITFTRVKQVNGIMGVLIQNEGEWVILTSEKENFDFDNEYNWGQMIVLSGFVGLWGIGVFGVVMINRMSNIRNKVSIK